VVKRGLPSEVLRYFMLHHRLIPERSDRAAAIRPARDCAKAGPAGRGIHLGAGRPLQRGWCLTRIGDTARDISASDQGT